MLVKAVRKTRQLRAAITPSLRRLARENNAFKRIRALPSRLHLVGLRIKIELQQGPISPVASILIPARQEAAPDTTCNGGHRSDNHVSHSHQLTFVF